MNTTDRPPLAYDNQTGSQAADNFGINIGQEIEQRMQTRYASIGRRHLNLPRNVGSTDRAIRLGAGTALLAAAAFAPLSRGWRIGLSILGIAEIVTGSTCYCPVSHALGINTNRAGDRS